MQVSFFDSEISLTSSLMKWSGTNALIPSVTFLFFSSHLNELKETKAAVVIFYAFLITTITSCDISLWLWRYTSCKRAKVMKKPCLCSCWLFVFLFLISRLRKNYWIFFVISIFHCYDILITEMIRTMNCIFHWLYNYTSTLQRW